MNGLLSMHFILVLRAICHFFVIMLWLLLLKQIQLRPAVPSDACTHLMAIWSYESRTRMASTFPITYSKREVTKKTKSINQFIQTRWMCVWSVLVSFEGQFTHKICGSKEKSSEIEAMAPDTSLNYLHSESVDTSSASDELKLTGHHNQHCGLFYFHIQFGIKLAWHVRWSHWKTIWWKGFQNV